jgi:hypothetical protein
MEQKHEAIQILAQTRAPHANRLMTLAQISDDNPTGVKKKLAI